MKDSGILYIVSTPIGNLEDITFRAVRILKEVDQIACEDTRHTKKLLNHFQFSKPLISYYAHNQSFRTPQIIEQLKNGQKIALVTDAGTPGVSDPGAILISEAVANGIEVVPIPGPSAVITALSASGLRTDRFFFQGFLPLKQGKRNSILESLKEIKATLIFYESGRRLHKLFVSLCEVYGKSQAVIARELTKVYEEFRRGNCYEILAQLPKEGLKGESVVLIDNHE